MAYPAAAPDRRNVVLQTAADAAVDVTADGVRHDVGGRGRRDQVDSARHALVDALPALYIADGHHRSAAAARVSAARGGVSAIRTRIAISSRSSFPSPDDHPRLQPPAHGSERPHTGRAPRRPRPGVFGLRLLRKYLVRSTALGAPGHGRWPLCRWAGSFRADPDLPGWRIRFGRLLPGSSPSAAMPSSRFAIRDPRTDKA